MTTILVIGEDVSLQNVLECEGYTVITDIEKALEIGSKIGSNTLMPVIIFQGDCEIFPYDIVKQTKQKLFPQQTTAPIIIVTDQMNTFCKVRSVAQGAFSIVESRDYNYFLAKLSLHNNIVFKY